MIDKLNKDQEEGLKTVADEWLSKVFNYELTNEVTFEKCKNSMHELYSYCGLKKPIVLLVDSPMGVQLAANMMNSDQVYEQVRDQVRDQVYTQVSEQVYEQVREQVYTQVSTQVREQVSDQVRDQVRDQVYNQVYEQVTAQVTDQVRDQVYAQVREQVYDQVSAQVSEQVSDQVTEHKFFSWAWYVDYDDLGWLSFLDYFQRFTDVEVSVEKQLKSLKKWCQSSFISVQLDGLCICSKPPIFISRDSQNNMHNTSRTAIEFSDGYGLNYVNGRFVEHDIFINCQNIEGAKKEFLRQENEDIKAAIITIVKENEGQKGLMQMLDAYVVDERELTHPNSHKETVRLFKTKTSYPFLQDHNGNMGQPYCWSEMQCPSTGSTYLIDNSAAFDNAIDAMKFLRPSFVPMEVEYSWQEFTN